MKTTSLPFQSSTGNAVAVGAAEAHGVADVHLAQRRRHLADGLEAALDEALARGRAGDAEGALAGAEDAVLAELAGLEVEGLAQGLVLELEAQGARVERLVDDLGDGGELRLVDVHEATGSGPASAASAASGRRAAMSIACEDLDEVLAGVADARAAAAAGAQHLAELERVDRELVVDALAVARVLVVARVVAAGVQREGRRLAGVPAAAPGAAADALFLVDDVEAVAGGAHARAGAAAVAAHAERGEQRVVEVRVDPVAHRGGVDLEVGGDAGAGGGALVVGLAAARSAPSAPSRREARRVRFDEGAPLVGGRLDEVAALDRREQAVGALGVVRRGADGGAEAARRRSTGQARLTIVVASRRPFQSSSS